jgi:hypothetical protein
LNKRNFYNFISDQANIFICNYFADNNGLKVTDPFKQKPACRNEVLSNLL